MSYMSERKNYYRLSPKDLSHDAIKTLRWTSLVGVLSSVSALLMLWSMIPANPITGLILFLGFIFGFIALLHRLPNLLSISGKHLDEWSGNLKQNAEAFTYRMAIYFLWFMSLVGFAFLMSDITGLRLVLAPTLEQVAFSLFLLPVTLQFIIASHVAWSVKPLSNEDVKEMSEIESPRKSGKWMTFVTIGVLVLGSLGGRFLDYKYQHIIDDAAETCVITMETEVPLAQLKHLQDCESLKVKRE